MADAANEIEEGGGVTALKDLFSGAVGGIAQVLIGVFVLFRFVWMFPFQFWSRVYLVSSPSLLLIDIFRIWSSFLGTYVSLCIFGSERAQNCSHFMPKS